MAGTEPALCDVEEKILAQETEMVIHLNDYCRARARKLPARRSDDELLCVNWNPAFGVVALSCYQTPQQLSPQLPDDFEGVDVAALTERLYALASQI
jgi:hypothetical protein